MNIHIIPTQTRHFQTSYTKKVSNFHSNLLTWIECCGLAGLLRQSVWHSCFFSSRVSTCPRSRLCTEDPILSWWVALLLRLHSGSLQGYNETGPQSPWYCCVCAVGTRKIQFYSDPNGQLGNALKYQKYNKVNLKFHTIHLLTVLTVMHYSILHLQYFVVFMLNV